MAKRGAKKIKIGSLFFSAEEIIQDYRIAYRSRQASILGRREVMTGRAKFGIFGDGKEVAQIAMAKAFRNGDFRSGYYRDQTFMFAAGMSDVKQFFAQLYAHADVASDPASAGRGMSCHFGTRSLTDEGIWKNIAQSKNSSSDISPTGAQMPRLVGLAYASKLYRQLKALHQFTHFSHNGEEIAFGTIGNASCAEGLFWESVNAIGVLKAPALISIWDDGYGISVTNEFQLTKENISSLLKGFQREPGSEKGFDLYEVKGWDFPELIQTYINAAKAVRKKHIPAIIHVTELTQPQGHSTSGSHERYKSKERLAWEKEHDCLKKMREWLIAENIVTTEELGRFEQEETALVKKIRDEEWQEYIAPIQHDLDQVADIIDDMSHNSVHGEELKKIRQRLLMVHLPLRREAMKAVAEVLLTTRDENHPGKIKLFQWKKQKLAESEDRYSSHLVSQSDEAVCHVREIRPVYAAKQKRVNGFEILNACFDAIFARDPRVVAFGEDVGRLGAVNQGFRGLQEKYGDLRISDTGIRECTIIGQAIGVALRGLRPIAEIQYLDYLLYALQILSDDLATLQWRTKGGQKAPVIIRTRGHRLEGVWHAGSPLAGIINLMRGINVLVPRNMTQAAGFYNTLLQSDEPGLIVEVLNGYRLKENMPENIGEIRVPVGTPEILLAGDHVTIVTYGACCQLALDAASVLNRVGVRAEVIDVQSLLPFDLHGIIGNSISKTNRVLFLDEDVPGGATAYMMQEVIEKQDAFSWLDGKPRTLTSKPHRPSYGSDGDYFSKPNVEQIVETVYHMMHESNPKKYPLFFEWSE